MLKILSQIFSLLINHSPVLQTVPIRMTQLLPEFILQRGATDFLFSVSVQTGTAHQGSFSGAMRPERRVDHPPSSANQVTHEYSCTSTLHLCIHNLYFYSFRKVVGSIPDAVIGVFH